MGDCCVFRTALTKYMGCIRVLRLAVVFGEQAVSIGMDFNRGAEQLNSEELLQNCNEIVME